MKKTTKGFTIVELVIVIAVIAILAAVLVPTFSGIIKKAKISVDTQLIRNLNIALKTDVENEHKTMQSALECVEDAGFNVAKINATEVNNEILWDSVNDVFCYLIDDEITYISETEVVYKNLTNEAYWQIDSVLPNNQKYSLYYIGNDTDITVNGISFDAGNTEQIKTLKYVNTSNTVKDVIIRTNSYNTEITIDAATDSVTHYGKAKNVKILNVATNSYHETGDVLGNIVVNSGRVVVEKDASANAVVVDVPTDTQTLNKIDTNELNIMVDNTNNPVVQIIVKDVVKEKMDKTSTLSTLTMGDQNIVVVNDKVEVEDPQTHEVTKVETVAYLTKTNKPYASFEEAFNAMQDGDTLILTKDTTLNKELVKGVSGNNEISGVYTVDLGGYTLTVLSNITSDENGYDGVFDFYNVNITMKNGVIDDRNNSFGTTINVLDNTYGVLENLEIHFKKTTNNYGAVVGDTVDEQAHGVTLVMNSVVIDVEDAIGAQLCGGGTYTLNNCTINQHDGTNTGYGNTALAIAGGGKVTINGGSFTSSKKTGSSGKGYALYVYNSGGEAIINNGYFMGDAATLRIDNSTNSVDYAGQPNYRDKSVIKVINGTIVGTIQDTTPGKPSGYILSGGTYSEKPSDSYLSSGCKSSKLSNNTWIVK